MRVFLDTSAIVPAFLACHPNHARSLSWVGKAMRREVRGALALHSIAETWRVLSSFPGEPRADAGTLLGAIESLLAGRFDVIEPVRGDYRVVVQDLASRDLRGPIVYDALLLQAARRSGPDIILTYNLRDFRRLAPDLGDRIQAP